MDPTRHSPDTSPLADRFGVTPSVVEDLIGRRMAGARDGELIALLGEPARGGLSRERAQALLLDLEALLRG